MMKNEAEGVTGCSLVSAAARERREEGPQTVAEKSASQVYLHEKCLVFGF